MKDIAQPNLLKNKFTKKVIYLIRCPEEKTKDKYLMSTKWSSLTFYYYQSDCQYVNYRLKTISILKNIPLINNIYGNTNLKSHLNIINSLVYLIYTEFFSLRYCFKFLNNVLFLKYNYLKKMLRYFLLCISSFSPLFSKCCSKLNSTYSNYI